MPSAIARETSFWLADLRSELPRILAASAIALSGPLVGMARASEDAPRFNPEEHTEVCEYILQRAGSVAFLRDHLVRYGVFDANNDGKPEIVEQGATGTMRGDAPRLRSLDGSFLPQTFAPGAFSEAIRWTFGAAWLPYKGRFYRLAFEEEAARFVRAVLYIAPDNTMHGVCSLDNEVTERMSVRSGKTEDVEFCRRYPEISRPLKIEFIDPAMVTVEQLNRSSPGSLHFPVKQAAFDFDNDGTAENIMMINIASSAGRGCDLTYYELLDRTATKVLEGPKRDLLLALQEVNVDNAYPHTRCGTLSQWVENDGEVYFETGYAGASPRRAGDLFHRLRAVRGSRVEEICESSFVIRPVLEKSGN